MKIVIIDSGVDCEYDCERLDYPLNNDKASIQSGHGTAVYNIIHKKCHSFAEILNVRLLDIEKGVDEKELLDVLKYVNESMHPDIINLSLGVSACNSINEFYSVCRQISDNGTIIVSAFDNAGSISYPAAFDVVVGVTTGVYCKKSDDIEFINDDVVNIAGFGKKQRVVWTTPKYTLVQGNSFACAHVTAKIAQIMHEENVNTKSDLLEKLKTQAIFIHNDGINGCNKLLSKTGVGFKIGKAAIFPFNKEMHSLIRYHNLLDFEIVAVYESKYSALIGSTTSHVLKDRNVKTLKINNIENCNWNDFDTIILGHLEELSLLTNNPGLRTQILTAATQENKNIYSFDDLSLEGYSIGESVYYPKINSDDLPPNRFGMLYRITKPVLGIFGTSSRQGKFTLQLKLREILIEQGYDVGQIGSEPSAPLFSMEYVFPMGYNSSVYLDNYDMIRYLNGAINDMCTENKDIIIVGSQSGTIPFDNGNLSQLPISQHAFLIGTQPDAVVLTVNIFDDNDYIFRTINYIESFANAQVIAIVVFPIDKSNGALGNVDSVKAGLEINDKLGWFVGQLRDCLKMPVFILGRDEDMSLLVKRITEHFS